MPSQARPLTIGVQVVNAWNTVWGNHNMQNVGLTAAWTHTKFALTANYYVGDNHINLTPGVRNLFDTTLLLTPSSKVNFYINYDYGRDNHVGGFEQLVRRRRRRPRSDHQSLRFRRPRRMVRRCQRVFRPASSRT